MSGPFDLIFQDGDKRLYSPLLDRLVSLLRPRGLLVTDNVLWDGEVAPGYVATPTRDPAETQAIADYNARVAAHPALVTVHRSAARRRVDIGEEHHDDRLLAAGRDRRRGAAQSSRTESGPRGARAARRESLRAADFNQQRAMADMTIETFGRRLRAREITCEQATEDCLQQDRGGEPAAECVHPASWRTRRGGRRVKLDRELAAGHDRGPLHGVPISIKDLLDIRGVPTTAASRVREGHVAVRDAPAIAHLRQAGAVFVGKTNLHEFAFGTTNEDSAFGPARNPHDPSRSPGGSSGGSGASVAAGMALASIGTDTGGSIRIPAAACGIVGLKPSFGDVSIDGVVPLVADIRSRRPADAVRSPTRASCITRCSATRTPCRRCRCRCTALRLAVPRRYFCDLLDDEVRARFEAALDRLRARRRARRRHRDPPHGR